MGKPRGNKEPKGASDKTMGEGLDQAGYAQEGGPAGQVLPDNLQLHLDRVLEAIAASRVALEQNIENVVIDVNLLRADQRKLRKECPQMKPHWLSCSRLWAQTLSKLKV